MSIDSVMPSNYLILCHPLFLLSSVFPRSGSFPVIIWCFVIADHPKSSELVVPHLQNKLALFLTWRTIIHNVSRRGFNSVQSVAIYSWRAKPNDVIVTLPSPLPVLRHQKGTKCKSLKTNSMTNLRFRGNFFFFCKFMGKMSIGNELAKILQLSLILQTHIIVQRLLNKCLC